MEILSASMIAYTRYMQNRMPPADMRFEVSDKNTLIMSKQISDGTVLIEFIDEDTVTFTYECDDFRLSRNVDRAATFNGAMIEIFTHGRDHYENIIKNLSFPSIAAQYQYEDKRKK